MIKKSLALVLFFALFFAACAPRTMSGTTTDAPPSSESSGPSGPGMGMGMGGGMQARHHAVVPDEFAGMINPVSVDDASIARGEDIYVTNCAVCHGETGMGEGAGGETLDPRPAPIAHTSQMMGDDYLFWRITEGGAPFDTGMIPYRAILDEQARWDVINYVRALGRGQVGPGRMQGPSEAEKHDGMLATALEQDVITQAEADTFLLVHNAMDTYVASSTTTPMTGTMPDRIAAMVDAGLVSADDAASFLDVHQRLIDAGLMQ
jgi:mono/diheme cytochrome c family protein